MHDLSVYIKEGLPFARDLPLENSADSYLCFPLALLHSVSYFYFLPKMTKVPGDIMILHKCTKNHDHMLSFSWDTVCDGCNSYFSFWATFYLFTPPNSPKNENIKKMKKSIWDIIILHKCTKNHDHMLYCSHDCSYDTWRM